MQGVILFMFGHNPAPLPPHALSCLPWMLSARRNPLSPAGAAPSLVSGGKNGGGSDEPREGGQAEEGASSDCGGGGGGRRAADVWILVEAINALVFGVPRFALERSRGGEFIEPRVAPRPTDGRGGRACRGRRQGGRCNAGNGNGEDPREKRRDEARKDEERRSEKTEKRRGDDSKRLQGRQVLPIQTQMV